MATRAPLFPHIIVVSGKNYAVKQPDIYSAIGDLVGCKKAPDPDNTQYSGGGSPSKLAENGELIKIKVMLDTKKIRSLLCSLDKASSAVHAIVGKQLGTDKIKTAWIPRRMRLG